MYRLDKNAFKIQKVEEADNTVHYWMKHSPAERLKAAWYLICCAYNLSPEEDHRLDRNAFAIRKRS